MDEGKTMRAPSDFTVYKFRNYTLKFKDDGQG